MLFGKGSMVGNFRIELVALSNATSVLPVRSSDLQNLDTSGLHIMQQSRAIAA